MGATATPVSTAAAAAPSSAPSSPAPASSGASSSGGESAAPSGEPASSGTGESTAIVPASGPQAGESNAAYLQRVQLEKLKAAGVDVDAEQARLNANANPFDDIEATTPQLEPAGEPEAAAIEPAKAEAEAAPAPVDGAIEDDPLSLQEIVPYTPRDLSAALKNQKVVDALKEAGVNTDQLFATARIATKGNKVLEAFDGDADAAIAAKEEAETFGRLGNMLIEGETLQDTQALLGEMMKLDILLDDDGNPRMGENNMPVYGGAIGRMIDHVFQLGIQYWVDKARELGNHDLLAHAEGFQSLYAKEKPGSAPAPDYSHLDDATRARLEEADTREKEVAAREAAEAERVHTEREVSIASGIDAALDTEMRSVLKQSGLADGQINLLVKQAKEEIAGRLANKTNFFLKRDALSRQTATDKNKTARIALGVKTARTMIPNVLRKVAGELGLQLIAQTEAAATRNAAQVQAGKSDVKGHGGTPRPAAPETPAQQNARVRAAFVAQHNRQPNTTEMFQAITMDKRSRARA